MSDIAKGILGGGWSLVAGWILPCAINVLIFGFCILPSLHGIRLASELSGASVSERSLAGLGAAVVIGLTLSALQGPLFRVLEGYLIWPDRLARRNRARQLRRKRQLTDRLELIRLRALEAAGRLTRKEDKERLHRLSSDPGLARVIRHDRDLTVIQRSLLRERLRRFPVDDDQVAPTRLGNAIRRLEEYGYQRYRLDSQALWYELTAAAPSQLRHQVDLARAGVDFFVCLLYGNLVVALLAAVAQGARDPSRVTLLITACAALLVTPVWYRLAQVATDDWTLAVRALVDVGRGALAEAVGLRIPQELSQEREMWARYCRFVRTPYQDGRPTGLEEFRVSPELLDQENPVPLPRNQAQSPS